MPLASALFFTLVESNRPAGGRHRTASASGNVPLQTVKEGGIPQMDPIFELIYTIGELLTMTWPGRLVLGVVLGSFITRLVRA